MRGGAFSLCAGGGRARATSLACASIGAQRVRIVCARVLVHLRACGHACRAPLGEGRPLVEGTLLERVEEGGLAGEERETVADHGDDEGHEAREDRDDVDCARREREGLDRTPQIRYECFG